MTNQRPKFKRVYVEAKDAETKERVFRTFYDTTPQEVIARIEKGLPPLPAKPRTTKRTRLTA